jgi:hypothetical protein
MSVRPLLIAAVLVVALPASASAKLRPYIPPGNSGANEYVESVPTAGGDNSTRNVISSGDQGSALAPATQRALKRAGADGRAAAAIANATAPRSRHQHRGVQVGAGGGGGTAGGGGGAGSSASGASAVGGVLRSLVGLQGPGGLGGVLPAILIATVLAFGAGRVWRRRTS